MTHILVADDNLVVQRMLSYTLQKQGYTLSLAGTGRQALDHLATAPVDLLICDLAMPDMDGLALLGYLRTSPQYARLPIIMLTASGQDEDRQQARLAGASDFLTKPTASRELLAAVARCLQE